MKQHEVPPLRYCKGIGEKREKLLHKLGIYTGKDLLFHFPRDYQDWRTIADPPQLLAPEKTAFAGKITGIQSRRARNRKIHIIKVLLQREHLYLPVIFFNQQYLSNIFAPGKILIVYGKIDRGRYGLEMSQIESWELLERVEDIPERAAIQPVYPLTNGLTQHIMRKIIRNAFREYREQITEYLPSAFQESFNIDSLSETLQKIHFPSSEKDIQSGRFSMKIREALFPVLYWEMKKQQTIHQPYSISYNTELDPLRDFIRNLPFSLTHAQKRVLQEIKDDLFAHLPMRRLLQGDVGSGKTIVAFISALFAIYSNQKACFMVPTEILALQHFKNLTRIIQQQGLENKIRPITLLGSLSANEKKKVRRQIAQNEYNFIIGTHALFQEKVDFPDLAYVIIDEQHRFGVAQRGNLIEKGHNPDVLIMTATPIPRTLTMTLYGDLKVSILDELPPGRQKVHTRLVGQNNTGKLLAFCRSYLKENGQIYVVCPLIEESEKLELKAATRAFEEYKEHFHPYSCGLLHGKMNTKEKQEIMEAVAENKIQVLISTTVIEVGVDVPNANFMIIEHPERFGLSQLHQLRGRIGRGSERGYCFLKIQGNNSQETLQRLQVLEKTTNGFEISHYDLEFRGPGEFTGTRQHGFLDFQFLDLATNLPLISKVRHAIADLLTKDPSLNKQENQPLKQEFVRKYEDQLKYLNVE